MNEEQKQVNDAQAAEIANRAISAVPRRTVDPTRPLSDGSVEEIAGRAGQTSKP